MTTVDEFSRLVSAIYASAVDPERWDATLIELVRAFDAGGSGLMTSVPTSRDSDVMVRQVGGEPSSQLAYNDYYGRLDYVAAALEQAPVGRVHTGTELILPNTNTEFYNDWCRPNEFGDGLFVRLTGSTTGAWLGLAAPLGSEPFGTPDRLTLIGRLVPHLGQAIRTQEKLAGSAQGERDLASAIERNPHGIVIVGPDGRVLRTNSEAERILTSGDGLRLRPGGSIAASLAAADRELHRLMHRALTGREGSVRGGGRLSCPRPSGRCDYSLHVVPLSADAAGLSPSRATALVVIADPDRELKPETATLRRMYSLTEAEAEVALRVARGDGLKPVAEEFAVSITTVRTHLQHVFDKTGTHRQAELVRLLLSVGPPIRETARYRATPVAARPTD
ncbi:helix-turn-helix transcriptional regulator [Rhodococcus sp. NPDC127528]|uniref:helix-turn-helix transcriptional regulator n=1 Tax=unclassified Rhodococcus (in: high G+C Gram-positive bacteria) TaxID=192944 RepID=UPI00363035D0